MTAPADRARFVDSLAVRRFSVGLDALLARIGRTEEAVGDRFPLYADPDTGRWTTTRRGSWVGGFWVGLLWLRAAVSGASADRATARRWTGRLAPRATDDTVTRGMTFWYGAGVGHRLCADDEAAQVAMLGSRSLAAAFDPGLGLIPVGSAFGAGPAPRAGIDALAGTLALLCWSASSGGPAARRLANRHASRHLTLLLDHDGRVRPEVSLTGASRADEDDGRRWARGQAWGVLGAAVAAQRLGAPFTAAARSTADRWLASAGTGVPPAWWGIPGAPLDTSAAAIAAAGLWTLGRLELPGAVDYRQAAMATAASLMDGHLDAGGALHDGCYDLPGGVATGHELIWGDYFLTALLAVLSGRVCAEPW